MSQIEKLNVPYEEIRSLVLEALKRKPETQYVGLCYEVGNLAVQKGIVPNPNQGRVVEGDTYLPRDDDQEAIREIICGLYCQW